MRRFARRESDAAIHRRRLEDDPIPHSLLLVLLSGSFAAAASLAGAHLVLARPHLTQRTSRPLVAFAGGTVLGATFLHLLPEAVELAPRAAWGSTLVAFLALYLVEGHTLPHVHGPHSGDAPGPHVHLGHMATIGFTAHALFDGLALGAGYRQGVGVAVTTLVAVLCHKLPEGMALMSLLLHGDVPPRRALRFARAIVLLTPIAALGTYALLGARLGPREMGMALGLVAGSFLYISASDLLPEIRRSPRVGESLLILLGVLVSASIGLFGR